MSFYREVVSLSNNVTGMDLDIFVSLACISKQERFVALRDVKINIRNGDLHVRMIDGK